VRAAGFDGLKEATTNEGKKTLEAKRRAGFMYLRRLCTQDSLLVGITRLRYGM